MKQFTLIVLLLSLMGISECLESNSETQGPQSTLNQNQKLISSGQSYFVVMQTDGNFVLYSSGAKNGRGSDMPTWASNTGGISSGPYSLVMQNDGNLVVLDGIQRPLWASNTGGEGTGPFKFKIGEDGNMTVTGSNGQITWSSNTTNKLS